MNDDLRDRLDELERTTGADGTDAVEQWVGTYLDTHPPDDMTYSIRYGDDEPADDESDGVLLARSSFEHGYTGRTAPRESIPEWIDLADLPVER